MPSYVPNAIDPTEPTESRTVESAALEFRTLKTEVVAETAERIAADAVLTAADVVLQANIDAVVGSTAADVAAAQAAAVSAAADAATAIAEADAAALSAAAAAASAASIDTNLLVARTSATGSAVLPSGTSAQQDATPQFGYARANTTLTRMEWWNGSLWTAMGGGATGGGSDTVFQVNSRVVNTAYEIPADSGASVVGPLTLNAALTFGANSRLVVL
jgi:hypothetical protein